MDISEKLLNNVSLQDNGCWMFLGSWNSDGYGNIRYQGKTAAAHRLSYELFVEPIPSGFSVLHDCDNPWCVNPEHLFLGTQLDNVRDMISKGRDNFIAGRKLNEGQVAEIRELLRTSDLSLSQIGRMYDVSACTIFSIKHGVKWK